LFLQGKRDGFLFVNIVLREVRKNEQKRENERKNEKTKCFFIFFGKLIDKACFIGYNTGAK